MEEKKAVVSVTEAVSGSVEKEVEYFSNLDFSKVKINLNEMFKNGVHFGHHKSRKNPKMDEYIFGVKNGISIIDLQKTEEKLREALFFIQKVLSEGQDILFVGTKKQAKKVVEAAARKCEMPFVTERWLGGTFSNFNAISQRTRFLREGQEKLSKGEYAKYTKFEQMKIAEELNRLETKMGGIKNMNKMPGAILVTGIIEDSLAVKEARIKNIPVIAFVDSNVNPRDIDYPIPVNEDAVSSLRIMLTYIAKAVLDSKKKFVAEKEATPKAQA
jgi:small subunit ribosomal protein S2